MMAPFLRLTSDAAEKASTPSDKQILVVLLDFSGLLLSLLFEVGSAASDERRRGGRKQYNHDGEAAPGGPRGRAFQREQRRLVQLALHVPATARLEHRRNVVSLACDFPLSTFDVQGLSAKAFPNIGCTQLQDTTQNSKSS